MTRVGWLLTGLLCFLLGVGWYFLVFSPTSENIEVVRADTVRIEGEILLQEQRLQVLRQIRAEAPEAEASLAFGRSLIPDAPEIPSLFRQLQQATNESGARLETLTPSPPQTMTTGEGSVAAITVSMSVEGSYFQLVDLARRIEDPQLTPRALRWNTASLDVGEYPLLNATFVGTAYSRSSVAVAEDLQAEEEVVEAEGVEGDVDPDAPIEPPTVEEGEEQ